LQNPSLLNLVCGFNTGFRIGFQGDRHFRASPNLKSASEFPEIVEEKLVKEISQGRIAGPSITNVCFSHSCIGTHIQNNFNGIVN
jgi:hypothetical protein